MKHTKKLVSLLLALVMVFALAVPALAANHTYEIYQIFTGDYSEGILSNVKWGQNGTGNEGTAVDKNILAELGSVKDATSDTAKLAVINKYANLSSEPYTSGTSTKYENLPNGYYLVKDQDGTQNTENGVYTLYIVQVVNGTLEFSPKSSIPTSEKKILEGSSEVDVNEASIGDEVKYQLTGTLPSNIADYNTYYYVFTDTLSKGLTYKADSIKVEIVNGNTATDVTSYFYKNVGTYSATDGTKITVGIQDLLALKKLTAPSVTITAETEIVVTYSATLNENAVIAGEGNPNDVVLKYSNDPNHSGTGTTETPPENPGKPETTNPTGETPKSTVVTYTTELTILKNDDNHNILTGAEFTLTGNGVNIVLVTTEKFTEATNGAYWKLTDGTYTKTAPTDETSGSYDGTTVKYAKTTELVAKGTGKTETSVAGTVDSETGTVTFTGLGAGKYKIEETKTPAGYNTIAPIEFELTFDTTDTTNVKFVSSNPKVVVGEDNKLDTTIVNEKGTLLPETGGMGTTLFYAIGGILVLAAVVLFVTKRRMSAEK